MPLPLFCNNLKEKAMLFILWPVTLCLMTNINLIFLKLIKIPEFKKNS
jgi:hypothetical protein